MVNGNSKLGFGKYKESRYSTVLTNDIEYCKWCLLQRDSKHYKMVAFQQWLVSKGVVSDPPTSSRNATLKAEGEKKNADSVEIRLHPDRDLDLLIEGVGKISIKK